MWIKRQEIGGGGGTKDEGHCPGQGGGVITGQQLGDSPLLPLGAQSCPRVQGRHGLMSSRAVGH